MSDTFGAALLDPAPGVTGASDEAGLEGEYAFGIWFW